MQRILLVCSILLFSLTAVAQKNVTTVGIQLKPIFPVAFLGSGKTTLTQQGVTLENGLNSGYSFGLIIRKGISDVLGIETGINYVRRNYNLTFTDEGFSKTSQYRIVSYEIPLVIMAYAQLSEKIFMNGSLGPSLNMYPSNLATFDTSYYTHVAFRNHILIPAVTANIGWEYRTEKSGTLYIGASFQRPFEYIFTSVDRYKRNNKDVLFENRLSGAFLTLDLRYFFHEDAVKK